MWRANLSCPYYHELKISPRKDSFNDITWKFELPLLSRAQKLAKIPQMKLLEYLNCSYTTREDFRKNKAVLLMWLENYVCPYYREVKFWQK